MLLWLLIACHPCAEVSADCDALYEPTFDNIHERTLKPSCALSDCHGADNPRRGLDLSEVETAYDALQDYLGDEELGCNELVARIDSDSSGYLMPPGSQLPEAERCAIRQWVEAGAPR